MTTMTRTDLQNLIDQETAQPLTQAVQQIEQEMWSDDCPAERYDVLTPLHGIVDMARRIHSTGTDRLYQAGKADQLLEEARALVDVLNGKTSQ